MLTAGILLINGLSFVEYLVNVDLGIDQLLLVDTVTEKSAGPPGRMSALLALCGLLLGGALASVARRG